MPESTITIESDQREGLYELIRNHLGSIEDFWVAFQRTNDFAQASSEESPLLDGIGPNVGSPDPRASRFGEPPTPLSGSL